MIQYLWSLSYIRNFNLKINFKTLEMKLRIVGLSMLMTLGVIASIAQDTFSDEELNKYATVLKWVDQGKTEIVEFIKTSVKENEILASSKYNSLSKADKAGDVSTVEATLEELEAYNTIKGGIDTMKSELSANSKEKILSIIGANLYNRLKKSLKTDTELKARYQAIYDGLNSDEMEEVEESEKSEESEDKAG